MNDYERTRQQRIDANQQMLRQLAIERIASPKQTKKKPRKRPLGVSGVPERRRSQRILRQHEHSMSTTVKKQEPFTKQELVELAVIPPICYTPFDSWTTNVPAFTALHEAPLQHMTSLPPPSLSLTPCIQASVIVPSNSPSLLQYASSSTLDIDFDGIHMRWLGKAILPKGKKTVMTGLCPSHVPIFSRMSGIQAWRNAIVLFVNVAGANCSANYFNMFTPTLTSTGRPTMFLQWFAQARQHAKTPVIQRLSATVCGDPALWFGGSRPSTASKDKVLLFIRHVEGPYIYCGRLGYLGHLADACPMEFRWQLLDFDHLDWPSIQQSVLSP